MNPLVCWPTIALVVIAAAADLRSRRIPNLLVFPFLLAGIAVSVLSHGVSGLGQSLAGAALSAGTLGIFVWLRGLGMGDLKLCAAVGAWVGPSQMVIALVMTSIAGGAIALIWAARHRVASEALEGAGELVAGVFSGRPGPHPTLALGRPGARSFPYAPAIAAGTIFSFFAS